MRDQMNPFWRNTKTEKHRGQQTQWNQSQINKSNAGLAAGQGYGVQASGENPASGFAALAANPMSPEEKAGILSSTGSAYDAMGAKAGERVAKTRNSAGYGALLDNLAQQKGKAMGETATGIGNTEFSRKMAALGGEGGVYNTDVGAQTRLLSPNSPNFQPGFWQNLLMQGIQGGAQVGSAALGG